MHVELDPRLEIELGSTAKIADIDAWARTALRTATGPTVFGALCTARGVIVVRGEARAIVRLVGVATIRDEEYLVAGVEIATSSVRTCVVCSVRGFPRTLTIPACKEARTQIADGLGEMLEHCTNRKSAFAAVARLFDELLRQKLRATPPEGSLGNWVLTAIVDRLEGQLGEVGGTPVTLRRGEGGLGPDRDGLSFRPTVAFGDVEQQVHLDFLGIDALYEPEPPPDRAAAALAVVDGWRERVRVTLAALDSLDSMMPSDVSWPAKPFALVMTTLRHGPAGPRPCAGQIGPAAEAAAPRLCVLDDDNRVALGADSAYVIDRFTIVFQTAEDSERISLRAGGKLAPIVVWYPDSGEAFSADADEPTFRLFADWLRLALGRDDLRFQDRDGEPLDHRVELGMIDASTYAEIVPDLAEVAAAGSELLRAFVREVIDPDARFGIAVGELGIP